MLLFERLTGRTAKNTATSANNEKDERSFRSVQVSPAINECCDAAKDIAKKRFLGDEAPLLPLPGCDALDCQCKYEHFSDRRQESRRVSDLGYDIAGQLRKDNKRNANTGRRQTD